MPLYLGIAVGTTSVRAGVLDYRGRGLRFTGGGARSRLWRQIKADVCGMPVLTSENTEAILMGDANLVAVATGAYSSLEDASRELITIRERLNPDPKSRADYETAYRNYCDLNDALDSLFRRQFKPV